MDTMWKSALHTPLQTMNVMKKFTLIATPPTPTSAFRTRLKHTQYFWNEFYIQQLPHITFSLRRCTCHSVIGKVEPELLSDSEQEQQRSRNDGSVASDA